MAAGLITSQPNPNSKGRTIRTDLRVTLMQLDNLCVAMYVVFQPSVVLYSPKGAFYDISSLSFFSPGNTVSYEITYSGTLL